MLTITLSVLAVTVVVAGFLLVAKRRTRTAQAHIPIDLPTAADDATALAERLAVEVALFQQLQPSADELAERQALDAAVRKELEQCADEELELLADLQIMFSDACPPETRALSTTRRRIAQDLLAARGSHDDKPEDSGHPPPPVLPAQARNRLGEGGHALAGRSDNETRIYKFFVGGRT